MSRPFKALLLLPSLALATTEAASQPAQFAPEPTSLCAEFSLFPTGTAFPIDFSLAAIRFHDATGQGLLGADNAFGGTGLRFEGAGIGITLPVAVPAVRLAVATRAGPVELVTFDAAGVLQEGISVAAGTGYTEVSLSGEGILYVSLEGGDGTGALSSLCIDVTMFSGRPGGFGDGAGGRQGGGQRPGAQDPAAPAAP